MALSFATGLAIFHFRSMRVLLLLPAVLFLRMALNAIDGMLAREHNQKSALGAILNELGDVFSDPLFICRWPLSSWVRCHACWC